jgi:hypothetical protein
MSATACYNVRKSSATRALSRKFSTRLRDSCGAQKHLDDESRIADWSRGCLAVRIWLRGYEHVAAESWQIHANLPSIQNCKKGESAENQHKHWLKVW